MSLALLSGTPCLPDGYQYRPLELHCDCFRKQSKLDSADEMIKTDLKSLEIIEIFIEHYDLLSDAFETLINTANGVSASKEYNYHNSFEEGIKIMKDIYGTNFKDLKQSRAKLVKIIVS